MPKTPLKNLNTERGAYQHTTYYSIHGLFSHFVNFLKNASQLTTHNLEQTADTGLIRDKMEFFESDSYCLI
jgi:hypothetical protein